MNSRLDLPLKLAAILLVSAISTIAKGEGVRDVKKYNTLFSHGFNTPTSIELAAGKTSLMKDNKTEIKAGIQLYRNEVFNLLGGIKHASARDKTNSSDPEVRMQMTGPDLELILFPGSNLYGSLSLSRLEGDIVANTHKSKLLSNQGQISLALKIKEHFHILIGARKQETTLTYKEESGLFLSSALSSPIRNGVQPQQHETFVGIRLVSW